MHELRGDLWIGNASDARNPRSILDNEIDVVMDLAYEETPAVLPREICYLRYPLVDGAGNDKKIQSAAIQNLVSLIVSPSLKIIICCSAGLSRSPAIAAAAIALIEKKSPENCLQEIAEICPVDVSQMLWKDITTTQV